MPNWCSNEVTIYSEDEKKVEEVRQFLKSDASQFDFNKVVPEPKDNKDWYNWRIEHWGTSRSVDDVEVDASKWDIHYFFDTAWSPPEDICNALREKFPTVEVNWFYREDGMQIAGWL